MSLGPQRARCVSTELLQLELIIQISVHGNLIDVADTTGSSEDWECVHIISYIGYRLFTFLGRQKSILSDLCSVLNIVV